MSTQDAVLRRRTRILQAALPVCTFLAALLLFGIRYEVNDDATLSNIASGAYGPQSQYLIYVNILIGFLLKPFYALFPSLNWFVILQLAADLVCMGILCRFLLDKFGTRTGLFISCGVLLCFGIDLFSSFQYVKNAALYLVTGFILIAGALGTKKRALFGGIFLVLLGSMIRFDNFYAVGGLSAAMLLWRFFTLDRTGKLRAVCTMAALFAAVFGMKFIDSAFYRADTEWQDYQRYNAVRTEISDFKLQFLDNPALVAEYGYNINDYWMIENWAFFDPEVFPCETLEDFADTIPRNSIRRAAVQTAKTAVRFVYREPMFLFLGLCLLGWALFAGKKNFPAVLGVFGMLGILIFYLCFKGRLPHRVEWSLAFAAALFVLFLVQPGKRRFSLPVMCSLLCVLCLASGVHFSFVHRQLASYPEQHPKTVAGYDAMSADREHLYLADIQMLDSLAGYDVFHARPKDYFANIVVTGGWTSGTPFDAAALRRFGYENPYRALAEGKGRVLLADFYFSDVKETYLHEHYGVTGHFEKIADAGLSPFEIYRLAEPVS